MFEFVCNYYQCHWYGFVNSAAFGAIIGVIIGWSLTETSHWWKGKKQKYRIKKLIDNEMKFNLKAIPNKIKVIDEAFGVLSEGKEFLNPSTVPFMRISFDRGFSDILDLYTLKEQAVIFYAYELMLSCDDEIRNMEKNFLQAIKDEVVSDAFKTYQDRLSDIKNNHTNIKELIEGYFNGNPIDVLNLEYFSKNEPNA